jgi:hypothetical protein
MRLFCPAAAALLANLPLKKRLNLPEYNTKAALAKITAELPGYPGSPE